MRLFFLPYISISCLYSLQTRSHDQSPSSNGNQYQIITAPSRSFICIHPMIDYSKYYLDCCSCWLSSSCSRCHWLYTKFHYNLRLPGFKRSLYAVFHFLRYGPLPKSLLTDKSILPLQQTTQWFLIILPHTTSSAFSPGSKEVSIENSDIEKAPSYTQLRKRTRTSWLKK